jgi:PAS domain S-box-containing protein
MSAKSSLSHAAPDELFPQRSSHLRLLFILIGSIFFAEVVAMSLIYELPPHLDYRIVTLIDAGVMTIMIFPVLYFLSFRPLILHIEKRQKAEADSREMALFPALNPDGVLQVDATGQIRKVNPAAARMGLSVGSQLIEVMPDLRELDLPACIAAGVTQQLQWEADLGERVLLWTVSGAPNLDLAFLYSVDITQRRYAEKAVRQLSRIVEQTEDTVVVTNCDGVIEYVNPAFERLTGYTKEEALGKTSRVLKSDIHDVDFYRNMWNTILAGEVFQSEIANRKKNGELYYEVKTIAPLRDVQGRITHFVATGKDITEHKSDEEKLLKAYDELELRVQERTEELRIANSELEDEIHIRWQVEGALRKSEQRLSRAQEIAHLGSWELDLEHNQLSWSDEVYRIFGLQPQEFGATYEAFLEAVHPDDRASVNEAYSSSIREGRDRYEIEHRVVKHLSGEVRIVHEKCEHFRDETGRIIRSVGMVHDITERKQVEEALRLSEEKYRLLADNSNDWIYWIKPDKSFQYISPACERVTGFSSQEFMSDPHLFIDITHPEDRKRVEAHLVDVKQGDETHNLEYRIITKKNEIRWMSHSCTPVFTVEGEYVGQNGTNRDITERKQAEDALRRSEALLLQTGETAKVGGWELDLQTMVPYWSPETYRIHEVDPSLEPDLEEAINYYVPEVRPRIVEAVRQAIEQGQAYDLELPLVTAKGRNIWIRTIGQPQFQEGKCVRLFGAFQDITDRKQTEEALRKAHDELELRVQERTNELAVKNKELVKEIAERREVERQLRIRTTAMEAAANGIVITDPQGCVQWTNPAIIQITGYEAGELVGQNMRIFSSGVHTLDYYHRMWTTILSGQVWRGEVTNRRKDGSLYMEEQTITPVRDENDQLQHFIAVKQDITERKRAEAELAERNIELQALSLAEHEQRRFSESLAEAALVLNKSMKLDEVLPQILEQVKAVIPYQLAIVMMFDGESFYDASHAGDPRWSQNLSQVKNRFPLDDFPLLKKMRQSHLPVLIPDTQKEKSWMIVHGLEWSRSILCVPLLVENQVIGFLNLLEEQPDFFTAEMEDRLVAFASHAAVAIQNAWLFEQVRASSERLQSLSRRLVEIQENERLYIARELHDEAGQMLTALMLDLVALESQAHRPKAVLKKVTEMEQALNAVSENLHSVAMALRPASLDHLGLVPALRQYVESIGERYRLRVSFSSGNFQERLPANMETELYRIVQEALTNVARHAHASQVDVILTLRDGKLIVMVEDDGNGFDPEKVPDTGHLGLFGMRERAEMIGGQLVIESKPGKGTTVIVEVNYDSQIVDRR